MRDNKSQIIDRVKRQEFDVEHGRCMRVLVLSESATKHDVIIVYHHLIMDGISLVVFLGELSTAYSGDTIGIAPLQAIELSTRQRDACSPETLQREMRHWSTVYPEPPAVLPLLPFSRIKHRTPLDVYKSYRFEIKLGPSFAHRVRSTCNQIGATTFHFYTAALAVCLSQWLDISDLSIGIVDANRGENDAEEADSFDAIGYFLNLVALRLRVNRDAQFEDLLLQTRDTAFSALENSTTPFETVLDKLHIPRDATCHPLFQVALNYRMGHPSSRSDLGEDCVIEWDEAVVARNPFDIHVDVTDYKEGGVWVSLFLQSYLYAQLDAKLLTHSFAYVMEHLTMAENAHMKVRDCPLASDADIHRAIRLGQGPRKSLDPWPETLAHRVDEMAALYPDDIAVKEGGGSHNQPGLMLTYSDTVRRSMQIAECLLQHEVRPRSYVGVFMAPTAECICAMLAIMRVGAVYMPLDTLNPKEQLGLMVANSKPRVILSRRISLGTAASLCAQAHGGCMTIDLDDLAWPSSAETKSRWQLAKADQPACALFTSGSTGRPKGVILTHRNLINQVRVVGDAMGVGREIILQQSSIGFDPSLEQIFGGLAHGGTVIVVPDTARRDPVAIAEIMHREGVTYTVAVPSEYASLLRYGGPVLARCGHTWRLAVSGGEKLRARLLTEFARIGLPKLQLINAYGPTECTVSCTRGFIDYRSSTEDAPLGCVLPNYSILIANPITMEPVPLGFTGEIYIGGEGVAQEYFDRPVETRTGFLSSYVFADKFRLPRTKWYRTGDAGRISENGMLYSLGRIEGDSQVKLRGVRIELDEVASVMADCGGSAVSNVALSLRGDDLLVAFIEFANHFRGDKRLFLDQLVGRLPLPSYMRPVMTVPIDGLPTTQNGKKDQRAIDALPLEHYLRQQLEYQSEHGVGAGGDIQDTHVDLTSLELGVKEAWEEVLPEGRGIITGRNADFFGVGGNSLLLLRLQSVLSTAFGIRLLLPKLFQSSTLGGMAESINAELERRQGSANPLATMDWYREIAALADQLAPSSSDTSAAGAKSLSSAPSAKSKAVDGLSILLTGATGFVGTSLLQLLVDDTRVCEVHCVAIRPDHHGHPRHITRVQEPAAARSKIVEHYGDLADRNLGLPRAEFNSLASTIDVVIHNGADVSLLKNYASLRRANVLSTRTLLDMVFKAASGRQVPIHFVSTAAVACFAQKSRPSPVLEEQGTGIDHLLASALPPISVSSFPPTSDDAIVQGYRCSKWASEALLERAVNENPSSGLSVYVHRPTSILGPGASDTDALGSIVRVSTKLRAASRLNATVDGVLDLVDVEDVAKAIVTHALGSASSGGDGSGTAKTDAAEPEILSRIQFVHHCNSRKMHMDHLGRYLSKILGCHIDECDQAEWLERAQDEDMGSLMYSFLREWEMRDANKIVFPVIKT